MREKIIAGNWKMNMLVRDAVGFVSALAAQIGEPDKTVVVCAGATCLMPMAHAAQNTPVNIGAQNVHWAASGAFTGELSAAQILETGAKYVVIGHSERRQYFGETDKTVQMRTLAALNAGLRPIVCVGETRAEREGGTTEKVLAAQLAAALAELPAEKIGSLVLAYEPVWAIGTGLVAMPEQAQETISFIRKTVAGQLGAKVAQNLPILYGGSMNEVNAHALLAMPDIDGGLIGGASLDVSKLSKIVLTKI